MVTHATLTNASSVIGRQNLAGVSLFRVSEHTCTPITLATCALRRLIQSVPVLSLNST